MSTETVTNKISNEGSQLKENKMTSDKINKMARGAVEDIKRAHNRLAEIQDACTHKETEIGSVDGFLQKTCKYCYVTLGYPTNEELIAAGYQV